MYSYVMNSVLSSKLKIFYSLKKIAYINNIVKYLNKPLVVIKKSSEKWCSIGLNVKLKTNLILII